MTRFRATWIQETLTPALAELSDALSQLDAASFPFEEAQGLRGAIQTVQRLQRESRALTIQEASSRRSFESLSPTLEAAAPAAQTLSEATASADNAAADDAIDFAGLTERCLDDESFLRNLMTSFRAQLDADLREAELLHLGRQWTPLSLLAGRALGTAENMAARQLSEGWRLCHA